MPAENRNTGYGAVMNKKIIRHGLTRIDMILISLFATLNQCLSVKSVANKNPYTIKLLIISGCFAVALIAGCGSDNSDRKPDIDEAVLKKVAACNMKTPELPVSGGLVLSICGQPITTNEVVYETMAALKSMKQDKNNAKQQSQAVLRQVLLNKVIDILLYQEARKNMSGNINDEAIDKYVAQQVQRYISRFGGNYAKALENLKKEEGFDDWKSFTKAKKRQILRDTYVSKKVAEKHPATYSELLNYYNLIKDEYFAVENSMEFRLIDIDIKRLADANDVDSAQAKIKAANLVKEINERLGRGEDFAELAKIYSNGDRADYGGLWKPVHPPALAKPYDVVEKTAMNLKKGEISAPIEAGEHIFIVQLESRQPGGYEPFEKVQRKVETMMVREQRKKMVDKIFVEMLSKADAGNTEEFITCCLNSIYQQL
ncbi:MAG: hypothetical protein GWO86_03260, partial [Planctomycetes bacterium]|nr:hypothetical protein [Planctomycetota bacterium]